MIDRKLVLCILGEGQFGKVYSAVNMDNGELMAMKEVCVLYILFSSFKLNLDLNFS